MDTNNAVSKEIINSNVLADYKDTVGYSLLCTINERSFERMTLPLDAYITVCKQQYDNCKTKKKQNEFIYNNSMFLLKFIDFCDNKLDFLTNKNQQELKNCEDSMYEDLKDIMLFTLNSSQKRISKTQYSEFIDTFKGKNNFSAFFDQLEKKYDLEKEKDAYKAFLLKCKNIVNKNSELFLEEIRQQINSKFDDMHNFDRGVNSEKNNTKKKIFKILRIVTLIGGGAMGGYFAAHFLNGKKIK